MLVVEEDGGHQRNVDSAPLFGTLSGENLDLVEAGFWGWLQREDGLFVVAFDCYVWKQGALKEERTDKLLLNASEKYHF